MQKSNKQFPSHAPWLTLASFCRRQREAHEALSSSAKWDCAAPSSTFKCDFRENHDPTKFKQKIAFSQKMYFATSAIYLMSFGSLGSCTSTPSRARTQWIASSVGQNKPKLRVCHQDGCAFFGGSHLNSGVLLVSLKKHTHTQQRGTLSKKTYPHGPKRGVCIFKLWE